MHRKLFFVLLISIISNSFSQGCIVNIPDVNFKTALVGNFNINTNQDSEISCAEAYAYTGYISVTNLSISDLTGIEYFKNLTGLQAFNNNIVSVNLSQNTKLRQLLLENNNLTGFIDVSMLGFLTDFKIHSNNSLTGINMANGSNTIITRFHAYNNPNLTCIQVDDVNYSTLNWLNIGANTSYNTNCNLPTCFINIPDVNFKNALVVNNNINTDGDFEISCAEAFAYTGYISVPNRFISNLTGIEYFIQIRGLQAFNNTITSVDLSQNTNLRQLLLESNNITGSLDISMLNFLTDFKIHSNSSLTDINIANGSNTFITRFHAYNNPSLTCIQVDDVNYSTVNWLSIDANTSYNTSSCVLPTCFINIPDVNFKNALVSNNTINTDGDFEISCAEAVAYYGTLNVANQAISDLTGIEEFDNINGLDCSNNLLTNLDLTNNTTGVLSLNCSNNALTSLILSPSLFDLELNCSNNLLTSLNLSSYYVTYLNCSNNLLTYLNIANGDNLVITQTDFYATNNPGLTCIQVDDPVFSNFVWSNNIDPIANFSMYCVVPPAVAPNSSKTSINNKSLFEEIFDDTINIYPNPVNGLLNIISTQKTEKIEVFNLVGEKVLETKNNSIDFTHLSFGIYVLKIKSKEGEIAIRKIIKK